jgi:hypothetical protein
MNQTIWFQEETFSGSKREPSDAASGAKKNKSVKLIPLPASVHLRPPTLALPTIARPAAMYFQLVSLCLLLPALPLLLPMTKSTKVRGF